MHTLLGRRFLPLLLVGLLATTVVAADSSSLERVREKGVLRWGTNAEGGAPYTFPEMSWPLPVLTGQLERRLQGQRT